MSHASRHQAVALAFALVSTLAMLSSMELLATRAHDEVGATAAPAQVVVVTGKRIAQS